MSEPTTTAVPPQLILLPRCLTGDAQLTACDCGGIIAYLRGAWVHTDQCPACLDRPAACTGQHVACTDPNPRQCAHGCCREPVAVAGPDAPLPQRCAHDGAPDSCCGCCWDLD